MNAPSPFCLPSSLHTFSYPPTHLTESATAPNGTSRTSTTMSRYESFTLPPSAMERGFTAPPPVAPAPPARPAVWYPQPGDARPAQPPVAPAGFQPPSPPANMSYQDVIHKSLEDQKRLEARRKQQAIDTLAAMKEYTGLQKKQTALMLQLMQQQNNETLRVTHHLLRIHQGNPLAMFGYSGMPNPMQAGTMPSVDAQRASGAAVGAVFAGVQTPIVPTATASYAPSATATATASYVPTATATPQSYSQFGSRFSSPPGGARGMDAMAPSGGWYSPAPSVSQVADAMAQFGSFSPAPGALPAGGLASHVQNVLPNAMQFMNGDVLERPPPFINPFM